MSLREELLALLTKWPDETPEVKDVEESELELETKEEKVVDNEKGTKEIEAETKEETQFEVAPEIKDITVINPNDALVDQSLEFRLASYWKAHEELVDTVKIALSEIAELKLMFEKVDNAIDTASKLSPTVATMDKLLNQL